MASAVLELKQVSKRFGDIHALRQVSLHVHRGEVYGVIGPNGVGKSTLVKVAAGLYPPTRGSVTVDGIDAVASPVAAKRHIGYVPDEPFAEDGLTGREYLEFVGELYGMDRARRDNEIARRLASTGLVRFAGLPLRHLSRGARQVLAFVAALMHGPSLLVIDDPTHGLDPGGASIVGRMVEDFAEAGGGVLLVTNVLQVVEQLCHRVAVLKGGALLTEGRISQVKAKAGITRGTLADAYARLLSKV
jgi:ABC-2 type transport system ATP-binding protein